VGGETGLVPIDLDDLSDDALAFLAERHLATLTTIRADGSPHVAPVGFTYEPEARVARVITFRAARRVAHIGSGSRVALSQVDGARWLTLEGEATVTDDPDGVAEAVRRYAERYRTPGEREDRVAIEVRVDRMMGRA
jgi:F420H(2)-dependent biliverdin reductase